MPIIPAEKTFPGFMKTGSGKKIRYKTLAENFAELDRFFLEYLGSFNIPVVFQKKADSTGLQFGECQPYPFSVRISNHLDHRAATLFGKAPWEQYPIPVLDYFYGDVENTQISQNQIISLGLAPVEDLKFMNRLCTKINAVMRSFFDRRDASLIRCRCAFGKCEDRIVVCGEFIPPYFQVIGNPEFAGAGERYFDFEDAAHLKKYVDFLLNATKA